MCKLDHGAHMRCIRFCSENRVWQWRILRMTSVSPICFTPRELISSTRIFNREYIDSAFSSSSYLKILSLSMRTWYLSFTTFFVPSWFSLIVFQRSLAFSQENTRLNTVSPRELQIAHFAIASNCFFVDFCFSCPH